MADSTIIAIAGLWKLVLCLVIIVALLVLRPVFPRLRRFKRGETEIEMENVTTASKTEVLKAEVTAPQAVEESVSPSKLEEASLAADAPPEASLFLAFFADDTARAEAALKEMIALGPDKKAHYEVLYHKIRVDMYNDATAASKLESYLEKVEYGNERSTILSALAHFATATDQTQKALEYYDKIVAGDAPESEKASAWTGKAALVSAGGKSVEAVAMLVSQLSEIQSSSAKAILYRGLATAHKALGNKEEEAMALEKASEHEPSDTNLLFQAAYAASEIGLTMLAFRNYGLQVDLEEAPGARNNLAVELSKLGMPFSAMRSYKMAADGGNTLALSNIAHAYIRGGFKDEAESAIKRAREVAGYDRNIDLTSAELANQLQAEEEKTSKLRESAILFKTVAREYASALLLLHLSKYDLSGDWTVEGDGIAQARKERNSVIIEWGKQGSRRKLDATVTNRALRGTIHNEQPAFWSTTSTETRYDPGYSVIGFVSENHKAIRLVARNDITKDEIRLSR